MANSTSHAKTNSYPHYLGISYDPKDFDWDGDQVSTWDWTADAKAVAELYQKGGHITTIYNEDKFYFTDFYDHHNDNRLLTQHFQRPLTGLMITVPDHVIIERSLNLMININNQHSASLSLRIQLGTASRLTVNSQIQFNDAAHASVVIYGTQQPNSSLNLGTELTNQASQNITMFSQIEVAHDAKTNWTIMPNIMGKLLGTATVNLNQSGGEAKLKAIGIGAFADQIGLQSKINHFAPHTKSRIQMRGVLFDQSQINFTSVGKIVKGAFQSDAQQESRLMTIGKEAKGTVNPLLLIDENDVQAGHAASVGQYDETQWYYLLSRGVEPPMARKMLVNSFVMPMLNQLNTKLIYRLNRWIARGAGDLK